MSKLSSVPPPPGPSQRGKDYPEFPQMLEWINTVEGEVRQYLFNHVGLVLIGLGAVYDEREIVNGYVLLAGFDRRGVAFASFHLNCNEDLRVHNLLKKVPLVSWKRKIDAVDHPMGATADEDYNRCGYAVLRRYHKSAIELPTYSFPTDITGG